MADTLRWPRLSQKRTFKQDHPRYCGATSQRRPRLAAAVVESILRAAHDRRMEPVISSHSAVYKRSRSKGRSPARTFCVFGVRNTPNVGVVTDWCMSLLRTEDTGS